MNKTLLSFNENLLKYFRINKVFVNIDTIFGDENDRNICIKIIDSYFEESTINKTKNPSFGASVKWLWSNVSNNPFLHLEDDWLCLQKINPQFIINSLNKKTKSVSLLSYNHGKKGDNEFSSIYKKYKLFGFISREKIIPHFNMSPSFFDGEFGKNCSDLMDPELDPEKQFREGVNEELFKYAKKYKCKFLKSDTGEPIVKDIGREWQKNNSINKFVSNGKSYWEI